MAKKMYYTEEEASARLNKTADQIRELVSQRKLRAYQDGAKRMYKAEEVDALAGPAAAPASSDSVIELSPMDSTTDAVSIVESAPPKKNKDDTVITSVGISIFDTEDLEIQAADPMAKTQITPSMQDRVSLEGAGSGSGLLDLTRESDDTSLGPVLDDIDIEGAVGSELTTTTEEPTYAAEVLEPVVVEEMDPKVGAFSGLVVAMGLIVAMLSVLAVAALQELPPLFLAKLGNNIGIFVGVLALVLVISAVVGMMMTKSAARQVASRTA